MQNSREFQGKTIDLAIQAACDYFNAPREKLEIEIINDAKAGLFGLIGARPATILARRMALPSSHTLSAAEGPASLPRKSLAVHEKREQGENPAKKKPVSPPSGAEKPGSGSLNTRQHASASTPSPVSGSGDEPSASADPDLKEAKEGAVRQNEGSSPVAGAEPSFENLEMEKLHADVLTTVERLASTIAKDVHCEVYVDKGRINVSIDGGSDSGLLIGREGQTLAAIQYLATRIVSKLAGEIVPIQLDAGDYKERQDEKIKEMAQDLARRVHETGHPCSTRPLSSYHRRLVHMALHDDKGILTRSKGEGAMKRVVLFPRGETPDKSVHE